MLRVGRRQRRAAIHLHAVIRLDGIDPGDPAAIVPPPPWADATLLEQAIRDADTRTALPPPTVDDRDRVAGWGGQLDIKGITLPERTAGYVAKYATKTAADTLPHLPIIPFNPAVLPTLLRRGLSPHAAALVSTCFDLARRPDMAGLRLTSHAHTLGFAGHFLTKSRYYATTMTAQRAERRAWRHTSDDEDDPWRDGDGDTAAVGDWRMVGLGYARLGLAPRTVHAAYKTLVAVLRSAHLLDKRIASSPCVGIVLPEIPDHEVHVLTVAKVRALALATPDRYRAAVWVAAGTGLRVSEVLALTWDRIDLDAGTVKVDRQINARRQFAPVKTKRSKRVVPLPDVVARVLRAHKDTFPPAGQTVPQVDGGAVIGALLVFTRPDGDPACGNDLRQVFRLARARADLPDLVTFHTLRHTYASLQIAAGTSLTALQERMGHGPIKVTSDTYGHLYPQEDDRTKAAIDAAFATDDGPDDDGSAGALVAA